MKNNKNNRLNAFKLSHKSNPQKTTGNETGIPNTDVLGMQQVNQAAAEKIHTSQPQNRPDKTGENNLKSRQL